MADLGGVNPSNESGSTPAPDVPFPSNPEIENEEGTTVGNNRPQSSPSNGSNQEKESLGDIRNALLVVATLIASTTYQALLQPPSFTPKPDSDTKKGFLTAYTSFMTSPFMRNANYLFFMSGNSFGFFVSVQMIICLTRPLPLKLPLRLSVAAMVYTYFFLMWYMPFSDALGEKFSLLSQQLLAGLPMVISAVLLLAQRKIALCLDKCIESLLKSGVPGLRWIEIVGDMYNLEDHSLEEEKKKGRFSARECKL